MRIRIRFRIPIQIPNTALKPTYNVLVLIGLTLLGMKMDSKFQKTPLLKNVILTKVYFEKIFFFFL
jgi:hypothetical protein